jgi:hypothetical protein
MAHKAPTYLPTFNMLDRQVEGTNARASEGVTV